MIRQLFNDQKFIFAVVSETSSFRFNSESLLARSLRRVNSDHIELLHFQKKNASRAKVFNELIETSDPSTILVFIDDDVWIDDWLICERLVQDIEKFDVLGLQGIQFDAGPSLHDIVDELVWIEFKNKNLTQAPHLTHIGRQLVSDSPLLGKAHEFAPDSGTFDIFTGKVIAAKAGVLKTHNIFFDSHFDEFMHTIDLSLTIKMHQLRSGLLRAAITQKDRKITFKNFTLEREIFFFKEKWANRNVGAKVANEKMEARAGVEPTYTDLQSGA
jgi:hypothetical protein